MELTSTLRHSSLVNSTSSFVRNTTTINTLHIIPRHPTHLFSSFTSPTQFKCLNFSHRPSKSVVSCTTSPLESSSSKISVLLEVDGVLIDAYRTGNCHSFNVAFRKLGLDCANWTQPIYTDLLRKGAGDEERMLALFFNRIGWPTSLPTSEKETFVKSVLQEKKKALAEFMSSGNAPLRPGIEKFIDDAYDEGLSVVILTAISKYGEETARSIVEKLGRMSKLKVVGKKDVEKSFYGQIMLGFEKSSGLEEELANEASKAVATERKKIAEEVASMLKLRVDINTGTPESIRDTVAALRAGAENAETPVCNCVLVAGSQSAIAAAEITGMPCIVLRTRIFVLIGERLWDWVCHNVTAVLLETVRELGLGSLSKDHPSGHKILLVLFGTHFEIPLLLTSRAVFPSRVSVMDGFGDVDLTVSKLRRTLSTSA